MNKKDMEEQLITEETAILADKAGFDYETDYFYCPKYEKGVLLDYDYGVISNIDRNGYKTFAVCEQSQLQKWLREEHEIDVSVIYFDKGYLFAAEKRPHKGNHYAVEYIDTYEKALELGLQKGLRLITQ